MENKSAEEVLRASIPYGTSSILDSIDVEHIVEAMKEYAQLEALAFHNWMEDNTWLEYDDEEGCYGNRIQGIPQIIYKLSELYQQFLNDKNK